ncbi:MAG: hypothetical protein M0R80_21490 [Proteobacteria bacterium]|jgi:hypothetical protein|nr:hypothetical protein [Pseudomonadota bacterium]
MPDQKGNGKAILALAAAALAAAVAVQAPRASAQCVPCADYDYLCCNIPADDLYVLTSFTGGESMACGGTATGDWYYSTSWVRWYCDAKLRITNPETGDCVVVQVADAGPASWVEDLAEMPIIDASTIVCEGLFGYSSCGWSDGFVVEAIQVGDDTPLGVEGCASDSDADTDSDTDSDADSGADGGGDSDTDADSDSDSDSDADGDSDDECSEYGDDGSCGCRAAFGASGRTGGARSLLARLF